MKQILNIPATSRTLNVRNGRFDASWGRAVRNMAAIAFAALLAAGCSTYAADRYAISMDSQTELKQIATSSQGQGIAVDNFTASEPGQTEIACRAVGPIKTPDGETFEAFIREALIDQLQLAEFYSPQAPLRLGGNLDAIDFDTGDGIWNITLTVTDDAGQRFTVREDYDFETSFYGETACNQTAQAFMPAVQNLIEKVVSHPVFQEMVTSGG